MRNYLLLVFTLITISYSSSLDIGGTFSIDYFNNPNQNIAPSPIQQRPVLFLFFDYGIFNLRTGLGITEANYTISDEDLYTPVFNEMYSGFYTIEFDLFAYPGISYDITDSISLGFSAGGGVRLPVLTGVDDDLGDEYSADDSMEWFYSENRFLFIGSGLFVTAKLPKSESTRFFGTVYYKNFIFRTDEWVIGTTIGLIWHL